MEKFVMWANANEGFMNLVLSFATFIASIVAIIVSVIAIKYPYKTKLSFSFYPDYNLKDSGNNFAPLEHGFRVEAINIGNQAVILKTFIIIVRSKFKNVLLFPIKRIVPYTKIDVTEQCNIFYKLKFLQEIEKSYTKNKYLYAYCIDSTNTKYKKRIGKIGDILKAINNQP